MCAPKEQLETLEKDLALEENVRTQCVHFVKEGFMANALPNTHANSITVYCLLFTVVYWIIFSSQLVHLYT